MGLESTRTIDAAGVEKGSGVVVLSLLDSWPWDDEPRHLAALRDKIEAYLDFVEGGEVVALYPDAKHRGVAIDIIFRFPTVPGAELLIGRARDACARVGVQLRTNGVAA